MDIIKVIKDELDYEVYDQVTVEAIANIIAAEPNKIFCITIFRTRINVYRTINFSVWSVMYSYTNITADHLDITNDLVALSQIFSNVLLEFKHCFNSTQISNK